VRVKAMVPPMHGFTADQKVEAVPQQYTIYRDNKVGYRSTQESAAPAAKSLADAE
jgi:hypothetical protein